jgi:hypothetical protein
MNVKLVNAGEMFVTFVLNGHIADTEYVNFVKKKCSCCLKSICVSCEAICEICKQIVCHIVYCEECEISYCDKCFNHTCQTTEHVIKDD